jgi:hypothetical protein
MNFLPPLPTIALMDMRCPGSRVVPGALSGPAAFDPTPTREAPSPCL